jgi:hypothetical protein
MSSRSARRNRHRPAAKALQPGPRQPRLPAGQATYTGDQVAALLMAAQQIQGRAVPMPRPPSWATDPFGPGIPLDPSPINTPRPDTGRAEPRLWEYPVATNLQIDARRHIPWRILQEAADIPLFRKCIERRKSVCQLDFTVGVDPKAVARLAASAGQAKIDVESQLRKENEAEIARISDWLAVPDRKNGLDWAQWTSLLMENRLVFDATVVYPRRTYGGDLFALESIDGKTIKPLLDEYGGRPLPPFPAYQQIMYGFPRGEFTADADLDGSGKPVIGPDGRPRISGLSADDLLYERTILRPHSPFGLSATEIALLDGMVWMRRMGWIMAEYTEGAVPATIVETDGALDWSVPQWEAWLTALNDQLGGNTDERMKFRLFPPGTHAVQTADVPERYKPDYDLFLIKLVAGDFGLPASEIGFTEPGALGASFHEGEEDILNRQTRRPDASWLAGIATRLAIRQLGMPPVLSVQILGLESEDEAAADAVAAARVADGRMTRNEDRARRGEPPYNFVEADMPTLDTGRGIVFLEGASLAAQPGVLIGPAMAAPTSAPPGGDPDAGRAGQADADDNDDADPPEPQRGAGPARRQPGAAKAEVAAYRSWARKPGRSRAFECQLLTKALAPPDMAADPRVIFFKADDAGPKAPAPRSRGLAGSGIRS